MKTKILILSLGSVMAFLVASSALAADTGSTVAIDYGKAVPIIKQNKNYWLSEVQVTQDAKDPTQYTPVLMDVAGQTGKKDLVQCGTAATDITKCDNSVGGGLCGLSTQSDTMNAAYNSPTTCRLVIVDCNELPGTAMTANAAQTGVCAAAAQAAHGYSEGYETGYVLLPNTPAAQLNFTITSTNTPGSVTSSTTGGTSATATSTADATTTTWTLSPPASAAKAAK